MAVDLFSMILSAGVTWGVSRLLDTLVRCGQCSSRSTEAISNYSFNNEHCPKCTNSLSQYVNATQYTVNKNRSIVAAHISNIWWPRPHNDIHINFDLNVINSRYEQVVVKLLLSEFRGRVFHADETIYKPRYEATIWKETGIKVPGSVFPEKPCTIALDFEVYNLWGDLLTKKRELVEPPKDSDIGGDILRDIWKWITTP